MHLAAPPDWYPVVVSQTVLGESGMQLEFHHALDLLLAHVIASEGTSATTSAGDDANLEEAMITELLVLIGYFCVQVR